MRGRLYSILKEHLDPKFWQPHFEKQSKGLHAIIKRLQKDRATPIFVSMFIDYPTSNMHSAVILRTQDSMFGNYMFEGTGPHHGDFCSISAFDKDEQDSVRWYDMIYKSVKSKNKQANDRLFSTYPPPATSSVEVFDTEKDEHFYRGFLGGVIHREDGAEYVRFGEKGATIDKQREMGVDVCTVINRDNFDLFAIPLSIEREKEYYKKTMEEMQYLSGFAPPLPRHVVSVPPGRSDECG